MTNPVLSIQGLSVALPGIPTDKPMPKPLAAYVSTSSRELTSTPGGHTTPRRANRSEKLFVMVSLAGGLMRV